MSTNIDFLLDALVELNSLPTNSRRIQLMQELREKLDRHEDETAELLAA